MFLAFPVRIFHFWIHHRDTRIFFIGRDAEEKNTPVAGAEDVKALEIQRLTDVIKELKESNKKMNDLNDEQCFP
jgi:F420-0:gamma-glutamyl ligase-like protein